MSQTKNMSSVKDSILFLLLSIMRNIYSIKSLKLLLCHFSKFIHMIIITWQKTVSRGTCEESFSLPVPALFLPPPQSHSSPPGVTHTLIRLRHIALFWQFSQDLNGTWMIESLLSEAIMIWYLREETSDIKHSIFCTHLISPVISF